MTSPDGIMQVFGGVAFGASALGLLLLIALRMSKPDLAPSWHMVSEYAIGPMAGS
ncbi:MAG: hypothetical protein MO852_02825 [Candidatus Devosia euplotis]|nr:hypothetical protein [Candidatus Devosia euplotis]